MLKFMLESYQSANIVDALLQIYQYPDGADVAVTAVASLAAFLEEHYGVDGTSLLAYLTVGSDIKLGRLDSDDTLSATDEMDAIYGDAGNDTVIGGSEQAGFFGGNDLLDGGDGLDKVNFNQAIETKALNKTFTSLGGGISWNISSVEIEKCVFLRFQVLKR
ncbi:hypothetical protein PhaeoP71_00880 [Phaeobacter piscinae]|nr:hypothetical protein PhaeoP71_00880 [Phaeobacter piscinae]